ncbi:transcriptional regulator, TetR family [Streptomyces sp. DvalAA-14]|uniref:TetR/AcrR family transcriptional regulator n=1 Tax=unclassified Streptomyces TaxID=2593676 RepID=UPI00081B7310|nr:MULTISPECIES: TetR/AcrR family transcriptional regulator [unclassified Streptomyces]MYS22807.1 TetR family transcriptional regulator [Streptomyces sp. SID4948]SCE22667.1 transcriptional regulator, TetR family [Streptomyces sp. DvalAA-14]
MTQPRQRATRSDAQDNRARIIEIARTTFTSDPDTTLQSIAKAAGVGQGTMYRHFPNREALLLAVYRQDVEALIDAAPRLLAEHEPLEALRRWFGRLAAYGRIKHGASLAIEAATRADLGSQYYGPVITALDQLLAACKTAGQLRTDADADEVLLLVSFLWKADNGPDWQERTGHMLAIVIDGLRAGADR